MKFISAFIFLNIFSSGYGGILPANDRTTALIPDQEYFETALVKYIQELEAWDRHRFNIILLILASLFFLSLCG